MTSSTTPRRRLRPRTDPAADPSGRPGGPRPAHPRPRARSPTGSAPAPSSRPARSTSPARSASAPPRSPSRCRCSAVVGIVVQVPAGHLGDTRGPRRVLTVFMVGGGAASARLPVLATTPWALALLLGVLAFFERGAGAVSQGVIAQLATGGRGVLFKAYLRAVTNTAHRARARSSAARRSSSTSGGPTSPSSSSTPSSPGSPPGTRPGCPTSPRTARGGGRAAARRSLRDWPFVVMTRHHRAVLAPLLRHGARPARSTSPTRTAAPHASWWRSCCIINTAAVALFQVRLSRRADSVEAGARALRARGGWIAAGFADRRARRPAAPLVRRRWSSSSGRWCTSSAR